MSAASATAAAAAPATAPIKITIVRKRQTDDAAPAEKKKKVVVVVPKNDPAADAATANPPPSAPKKKTYERPEPKAAPAVAPTKAAAAPAPAAAAAAAPAATAAAPLLADVQGQRIKGDEITATIQLSPMEAFLPHSISGLTTDLVLSNEEFKQDVGAKVIAPRLAQMWLNFASCFHIDAASTPDLFQGGDFFDRPNNSLVLSKLQQQQQQQQPQEQQSADMLAAVYVANLRLTHFPSFLGAAHPAIVSPIVLLDVGGNELQMLPPRSLSAFRLLSCLSLASNEFSSIPEEVNKSNLPALIYLNLSGNCIGRIPTTFTDDFGGVLRHLNISGNRLVEIPEHLSRMVALQELLVDHNHIQAVAPQLKTLTRLARFSMSFNALEYLPPAWSTWFLAAAEQQPQQQQQQPVVWLEFLDLYGNPLVQKLARFAVPVMKPIDFLKLGTVLQEGYTPADLAAPRRAVGDVGGAGGGTGGGGRRGGSRGAGRGGGGKRAVATTANRTKPIVEAAAAPPKTSIREKRDKSGPKNKGHKGDAGLPPGLPDSALRSPPGPGNEISVDGAVAAAAAAIVATAAGAGAGGNNASGSNFASHHESNGNNDAFDHDDDILMARPEEEEDEEEDDDGGGDGDADAVDDDDDDVDDDDEIKDS